MRRATLAACGAALVALFAIAGDRAIATTYTPPDDYEITCLDLKTGRELWRVQPGPLHAPRLSLRNGRLFATEMRLSEPKAYELDISTGESLPENADARQSQVVEQLPRLGNLVDSSGRKFVFKSGDTRHLEFLDSGKVRVAKELESFPHDLNIVGNLAIFNFASGGSTDGSGGGEVYAYNLKRNRLRWEFDASTTMPEVRESSYTGIAADKKRVYVSVNGTLIALSTKTGRKIWTHDFRQEGISAGWTEIGKLDGKLFVSTSEHLVLLNEKTGKFVWKYKAGFLGQPWPLVHGGMACLAPRAGELTPHSWTFGGGGSYPPSPSAIQIERNGESYTLTPMSRRDIPMGAKVWWALRPPPSPRKGAGPRIKLKMSWTLAENRADDSRVELDLTSVLRKESASAYVKFDYIIDSAELWRGRAIVAEDEW